MRFPVKDPVDRLKSLVITEVPCNVKHHQDGVYEKGEEKRPARLPAGEQRQWHDDGRRLTPVRGLLSLI